MISLVLVSRFTALILLLVVISGVEAKGDYSLKADSRRCATSTSELAADPANPDGAPVASIEECNTLCNGFPECYWFDVFNLGDNLFTCYPKLWGCGEGVDAGDPAWRSFLPSERVTNEPPTGIAGCWWLQSRARS